MRVSKYFRLTRSQPTLDFVDVDAKKDVRLFVDPRALRLLDSQWGRLCVDLIQDFFRKVLELIKASNDDHAKYLLRTLREPNETHLGLSVGPSRGRALGPLSSDDIWEVLSKSASVSSGLLEDLEDTILLVRGISSDRVSDMATNIIRGPLIAYTQDVCSYYGIPVTEGVDSGPMWSQETHDWHSDFVALPRTTFGKLVLVPKAIVRKRMDYDENEYFRDFILEHLREMELSANTELVRLLKTGDRRVTNKDLVRKYGKGKDVALKYTLENPNLLANYRKLKTDLYQPPLDHGELVDYERDESPDWDRLFDEVRRIRPGRPQASAYEGAVEALLTALFYPSLTNPKVQNEIHQGRKRIDITYTNTAASGFFKWLSSHYNAPFVFIECKNYSTDPGNPELDQLAGRFSRERGRFGILVCRSIADKRQFATRCADTATDGRGFIVGFDDDDLSVLTSERRDDLSAGNYKLLRQRFDALVM